MSSYATHIALFRGGLVVSGNREAVLTHGNLMQAYGVEVKLGQDTNGLPSVHVGRSHSLPEGKEVADE